MKQKQITYKSIYPQRQVEVCTFNELQENNSVFEDGKQYSILELTDLNSVLQKRIEQYNNEQLQLQHQNDELSFELQRVKQLVLQLQTELQINCKTQSVTSKEENSLKSQLQRQTSQIQALVVENEELRQHVESLQKQNQTISIQCESQVAVVKKLTQELNSAQQQLELKEKQLMNQVRLVENLEAQQAYLPSKNVLTDYESDKLDQQTQTVRLEPKPVVARLQFDVPELEGVQKQSMEQCAVFPRVFALKEQISAIPRKFARMPTQQTEASKGTIDGSANPRRLLIRPEQLSRMQTQVTDNLGRLDAPQSTQSRSIYRDVQPQVVVSGVRKTDSVSQPGLQQLSALSTQVTENLNQFGIRAQMPSPESQKQSPRVVVSGMQRTDSVLNPAPFVKPQLSTLSAQISETINQITSPKAAKQLKPISQLSRCTTYDDINNQLYQNENKSQSFCYNQLKTVVQHNVESQLPKQNSNASLVNEPSFSSRQNSKDAIKNQQLSLLQEGVSTVSQQLQQQYLQVLKQHEESQSIVNNQKRIIRLSSIIRNISTNFESILIQFNKLTLEKADQASTMLKLQHYISSLVESQCKINESLRQQITQLKEKIQDPLKFIQETSHKLAIQIEINASLEAKVQLLEIGKQKLEYQIQGLQQQNQLNISQIAAQSLFTTSKVMNGSFQASQTNIVDQEIQQPKFLDQSTVGSVAFQQQKCDNKFDASIQLRNKQTYLSATLNQEKDLIDKLQNELGWLKESFSRIPQLTRKIYQILVSIQKFSRTSPNFSITSIQNEITEMQQQLQVIKDQRNILTQNQATYLEVKCYLQKAALIDQNMSNRMQTIQQRIMELQSHSFKLQRESLNIEKDKLAVSGFHFTNQYNGKNVFLGGRLSQIQEKSQIESQNEVTQSQNVAMTEDVKSSGFQLQTFLDDNLKNAIKVDVKNIESLFAAYNKQLINVSVEAFPMTSKLQLFVESQFGAFVIKFLEKQQVLLGDSLDISAFDRKLAGAFAGYLQGNNLVSEFADFVSAKAAEQLPQSLEFIDKFAKFDRVSAQLPPFSADSSAGLFVVLLIQLKLCGFQIGADVQKYCENQPISAESPLFERCFAKTSKKLRNFAPMLPYQNSAGSQVLAVQVLAQ